MVREAVHQGVIAGNGAVFVLGGAEGIRTPDPLDANEVRYQAAPQPRNGTRQVTTGVRAAAAL